MNAEASSGNYAGQTVQTAVGATMIALSVFVVALRFYVRLRFNRAPLGWDDWLVLVALIATITAGLLILMGTLAPIPLALPKRGVTRRNLRGRCMQQREGLLKFPFLAGPSSTASRRWVPDRPLTQGEHIIASIVDPNSYWLTDNTNPDYNYTSANILHLKLVYISSIFYFSIVCPAKLSLLLLYKRIFSVSQSFNIQVLVLMAVVALFYVATTFASTFSCWPLKYDWINTLNEAPYCFNYNYFWLTTGIIEAFLDLCLIVLPVGMVINLQMSTRKRVGLTGVFLLGAL